MDSLHALQTAGIGHKRARDEETQWRFQMRVTSFCPQWSSGHDPQFQELSTSFSTYVYKDAVKRERERYAMAGAQPPVPGTVAFSPYTPAGAAAAGTAPAVVGGGVGNFIVAAAGAVAASAAAQHVVQQVNNLVQGILPNHHVPQANAPALPPQAQPPQAPQANAPALPPQAQPPQPPQAPQAPPNALPGGGQANDVQQPQVQNNALPEVNQPQVQPDVNQPQQQPPNNALPEVNQPQVQNNTLPEVNQPQQQPPNNALPEVNQPQQQPQVVQNNVPAIDQHVPHVPDGNQLPPAPHADQPLHQDPAVHHVPPNYWWNGGNPEVQQPPGVEPPAAEGRPAVVEQPGNEQPVQNVPEINQPQQSQQAQQPASKHASSTSLWESVFKKQQQIQPPVRPALGPGTPAADNPGNVAAAANALAKDGLPAVAKKLIDFIAPRMNAVGPSAAGSAAAAAGGLAAGGMLLAAGGLMGATALAAYYLMRDTFPDFKLEGGTTIPENDLIGFCISYLCQIRVYAELCIKKDVIHQKKNLVKVNQNLVKALKMLESTEDKLRNHMSTFFDCFNEWTTEVDTLSKRLQLEAILVRDEGEEEDGAKRHLAQLMLMARKDMAQSTCMEGTDILLKPARLQLKLKLKDVFSFANEMHVGVPVDGGSSDEEEKNDSEEEQQKYESLSADDLFHGLMKIMESNLKHVEHAQSEVSTKMLVVENNDFFQGFLKGLSVMQDDMQRTREGFHSLVDRLRSITQAHIDVIRHVHEGMRQNISEKEGEESSEAEQSKHHSQENDSILNVYRRMLHIHNMLETLI